MTARESIKKFLNLNIVKLSLLFIVFIDIFLISGELLF